MTKDKDIKTTVPTLRFREFQNDARWIPNKIDHVCKIGNGRDYKHLSAGNIPVYGSGGYMTSVDKFLYDGESVCIGRKGTIDKPIFLTGKFWTVDTLFYTYAFHKCLPKFLYLIFQQINWYKYNEAGGVPSLLKTTIGNINIFIPNNENEQKKIVDCFSSLDDLINAVADKIETLKEYKKGLMQQLFPAEGKTTPAFRFPEFQNKGEWEESTLGDICDMQAGKFVSASEICDVKKDTMYPCYGGNGLRGYTHSFTHFGIYPLIGRQGAQCGNITYAEGKFHATEHAVVVTLKKDIDIRWLYYQLIKLDLNQYATGQAQPGLSVDVIKKVTIRIPKNKNEQQLIACGLFSVDELISTETAKLDQLKAHKKGLMQQLFPKLQ
ncbi:restriction endonuclease subunit S [Parabacteroides distasonis]|uniref:Type I restriction modification DNA specificity domain protein n=1 Tax=Parabacteroides distasonis str. 3776 D15 i TaxID=1339342 RepID=A0AB34L599_PARDI|nr:restriction endonuclease subunit S [Parabacteroides distasonis]KDS36073.1 type I restriction modification DNA specificity domain protein [Parabacteroides distasonis str. 3776 D15 i]KDS41833.1 type I restriction modification DNA specificity domain protein [Parabacteroides distasonis str. 3776 Po2 i]KDS74296.1 type I restriction modification DNA specificity domain protein [Parabacteroides distasonis str. 3776 D15 iv]MDB9025480.1 restriction endonuclease subunit S [Parabacteroides distasonis]M